MGSEKSKQQVKSPTKLYHNINQSSLEQQQLQKQFLGIFKSHNMSDAIKFIEKFSFIGNIKLISSGSLVQLFCNQIEQIQKKNEHFPKNLQIYVFCQNISDYNDLLDNRLIRCVINSTSQLMDCIHADLVSTQTPQFKKVSGQIKTIQSSKFSYYLTGLTIPTNDKDKKRKSINDYLQFIEQQPQFKRIKVNTEPIFKYSSALKLYLSSPFFFEFNYHLKNGNYKYLQRCKDIISDLYHQIKKNSHFEARSRIKQSIFYFKISLNGNDNVRILNLINEDVQILGFLFASEKEQQTCASSLGNTLATIYIPQLFRSKDYQSLSLKRGYIDLRQSKQAQLYGGHQLLFNFKNSFRIINSSSYKQNGNTIDMIYGLEEYIHYIEQKYAQNSYKPFFTLYDMHRDKYTSKQKHCKMEIHLVGTVSKNQIICYDKLKRQDLARQTYFVLNPLINMLTGEVIKYNDQIQQDIRKKMARRSRNLICDKQHCEYDFIVRCSLCPEEAFCYCKLPTHNQIHLAHAIIMVEDCIPRFMEISFYSQKYKHLLKHRKYEQKRVKFQAEIKDLKDQNVIMQKYNNFIEDELFVTVDDYTRVKFLFQRATLWTIHDLQPSAQDKQNLEVCKQIVEKSIKDQGFIAKIIYNLALYSKQKLIMLNFINNYQKGLKILDDLKDITEEQQHNKVDFLCLFGQYCLDEKKYSKGQAYFRRSIQQIKKLKVYKKNMKLYCYNRLVQCLNNLRNFKEAIKYSKIACDFSIQNKSQVTQPEIQRSNENEKIAKEGLNQGSYPL